MPTFSPLSDLIDHVPGAWWLAHQRSPAEHGGKLEPYGYVRLIRTVNGPTYRVDYTRDGGRHWIPVGTFDGLIESCEQAHRAWLRSLTPSQRTAG